MKHIPWAIAWLFAVWLPQFLCFLWCGHEYQIHERSIGAHVRHCTRCGYEDIVCMDL